VGSSAQRARQWRARLRGSLVSFGMRGSVCAFGTPWALRVWRRERVRLRWGCGVEVEKEPSVRVVWRFAPGIWLFEVVRGEVRDRQVVGRGRGWGLG
jgi:hypothetical protein